MSIFEAIINHYNRQLDLISEHTELLTPYIAEAAYLLNQTFLEDGKVLCVSSTNYHPVAMHFCQLLDGQHHQRPALPHLFLAQNQYTQIDLAPELSQQIYARQINALAKPQDTLLIFSSQKHENSLVHAIEAANQVGMNLVLVNSGDHQLSQHIQCNHVAIDIQAPVEAVQAQSLQFLTASLLASLLEQLLFGVLEP